MSSILVINAAGPETRVALIENGIISEYYLERKKEKGIVGNIYKGKVVRVLPGMQAAFVDIGLEKAAFLYVADVAGGPDFSEEFELAETPEGEHGEPPTGEVPPEDTADRPVANGAAQASSESETEDESSEEEDEADGAEPDVEAGPPEAPESAAGAEDAAGPVSAESAPAPEAVAPDAGGNLGEIQTAVAPASPAEQAQASTEDGGEAAPTAEKTASTGAIRARPLEPLARKRRRSGTPKTKAPEPAPKGSKAQIQDLLREGQEVIVQVVKDPIGTKGARVTCHISLPGRHLVFMPTVDHVGISRRIDKDKERRRLRELVDGLRPPGTGFIVRTVADGVHQDKLVADIKFLLGLWNEMARKKDRLRAPALLHPDLDLILRSIRDLFSAEVEKLVIDDRDEYGRIKQFVEENVPHLKGAIEPYDGAEPIFDAYGIEQELTRALSRKVWLKSGGYLIIDQAEALVAIDVNSGRFVGKKNLEETITQINIEAAKEIVYQLRLRNIGGIIIIDFIDMEKQGNREKVFKALQEAVQNDRAKTNIVKISELGLVEMTRKRVRESVNRLLHEPCAWCDGKGYLKSKATVAYEIFREVQREASRREDTLVVACHPDVARYIQQEERETLRHMMMRFNKTVQLKPIGSYHQEQFDVSARGGRKEDVVPRRGAAPAKAAAAAAPTSPAGDGSEAPAGEEGGEAPAGAPSGRRRRRRRRRGGGGGGQAGASQGETGSPSEPSSSDSAD